MTLHEVYVSLGSNIHPETNLRLAVDALRQQCAVVALSSVYQSPAYGFENQPDFLDITAHVRTSLSPLEFKQTVLDVIEKQCGRDRASQLNPNGPLTLDMDILLWDESAFEFGEKPWKVPNKGILKFPAVLIPLAELAPNVLHPLEKVSIGTLASRLSDSDRAPVQKLAWGISLDF